MFVSRIVVWNVRVGSSYTEVVMTVVPGCYLLLKLQQGVVSYRDIRLRVD